MKTARKQSRSNNEDFAGGSTDANSLPPSAVGSTFIPPPLGPHLRQFPSKHMSPQPRPLIRIIIPNGSIGLPRQLPRGIQPHQISAHIIPNRLAITIRIPQTLALERVNLVPQRQHTLVQRHVLVFERSRLIRQHLASPLLLLPADARGVPVALEELLPLEFAFGVVLIGGGDALVSVAGFAVGLRALGGGFDGGRCAGGLWVRWSLDCPCGWREGGGC